MPRKTKSNNAYIEFVKANPALRGESAQQRISRVAQMWRQLKAQGGMYQPHVVGGPRGMRPAVMQYYQ